MNQNTLKIENKVQSPKTKLNVLGATALLGNDIFSSVFYVSVLVLPIAGIWAPLSMLLVSVMLFFFKGVYREVVESLPINGGAYNSLLNASTKRIAGVAGILMILAYMATAVISAKTGVDYLFNWPGFKNLLPQTMSFENLIILGTIGILLLSSGLAFMKIKNSSKVAIGIFGLHLLSILILIIFSLVYFIQHPELSQFKNNITNTEHLIAGIKSMTELPLFLPFLLLIFLGFSSSLLGLSSFESSANLIEEQKKGVFKKSLTNMLIGISIINPLITLILLNLFDLNTIREHSAYLLSFGGFQVAGEWLGLLITFDAFLVLCGAVFTSFIGVSRLMSRMALDECLPSFLLKEKNNTHVYLNSYLNIMTVFLVSCVGVLLISGGNLKTLRGVYGISFLSVLSMFAFSNLILKNSRRYLKRKFYWPTPYVLIALAFAFTGLMTKTIAHNGIYNDSSNLIHFLIYFIPLFLFISFYLNIDFIYVWFTKLFKKNTDSHRKFLEILSGSYVVFIHDIANLYKLLNYISINEAGRNVLLVHCKDPKSNDRTFEKIEEALPILNKTGVHRHLHIKIIKIDGPFGPKAIEKISKDYGIPRNHIFIGSIHEHHNFDYDELGGVRIIAA
jgi:amino acid transporter